MESGKKHLVTRIKELDKNKLLYNIIENQLQYSNRVTSVNYYDSITVF